MNDFIDVRLTPVLLLLADWSLRWGLVLTVLAIAFAVRPPRRVVVRVLLCRLVVVGGLLVPLGPCGWGPTRAVPEVEPAAVAESAAPPVLAAPVQGFVPDRPMVPPVVPSVVPATTVAVR